MDAEQLEKWIDEALLGQDDLCIDIDKIRELYDGKVLVPVEPTDAMVDALYPGTGAHTCRDLYQAMLAASQEQVSATAQEPT